MTETGTAPDVQIRRAKPEDAEICGRICYDAFGTINDQHNFPREWPSPEFAGHVLGMLFSHPHFYCVAAEVDGRIVGSNCLDERAVIAGVGPITVDPAVQNRRVGRALMQAVLDRAREQKAAGVRLLQGAFHNRSYALYSGLGFEVREPAAVMSGRPKGGAIAGCSVRPARAADLPTCDELCRRVHGPDRSLELSDGIASGSALVVERDGRITGYASGFGYFGHAVGEANLDVQALMLQAGEIGGPGMIVPTRNTELFRWCLGNGMRIFMPMTLMSMGLYN
ncbi:MAG: GNAT family N-acetyltransferase [Bryobacteraceae bacterium]